MSGYVNGPWRVVKLTASIRIVAGGVDVATIPLNKYVENDYKEANARLIAAAPDLLEALEELLGDPDWGCHRPTYLKARAAIARAKGEA